MYPLLQGMENPGAVIQGLVSIGYPAADIKIETPFDPGCPFQPVFEAITFGVEVELLPGNNPGDGEIAAAMQIPACLAQVCWGATWTLSEVLGAWTCTGWVQAERSDACPPPSGSNPPPEGYPSASNTNLCYYCGTATCTDTRVRQRRNWDCTHVQWTQIRTCTGSATGRAIIERGYELCPAVPDNAGTCSAANPTCTAYSPADPP